MIASRHDPNKLLFRDKRGHKRSGVDRATTLRRDASPPASADSPPHAVRYSIYFLIMTALLSPFTSLVIKTVYFLLNTCGSTVSSVCLPTCKTEKHTILMIRELTTQIRSQRNTINIQIKFITYYMSYLYLLNKHPLFRDS